MEKSTLSKKLAKYSALAVAAVAGIGSANAQIVYNNTGAVYSGAGTFNIDIDNDGTFDFSLKIKHSYWSANSFSNYIKVHAYNSGNQVIITSSHSYPAALSKSNYISSYRYMGGGYRSLANSYKHYFGPGSTPYGAYGNFLDGKEHYLGVKFITSGYIHYGWIRLKVDNSSAQATIYDWGYEKTHGGALYAGGVPDTYNDAGSGNWNDAANWDNGIPTKINDAVIPPSQSVIIDAPAVCFNFIDKGNGTSLGSNTLNVYGHFDEVGGNFNGGTGTVNLTGEFISDADRVITASTLKHSGTPLTFYNFTINNSNGNYDLETPLIVNGDFNITSCNKFTNYSSNTLNVIGATNIGGNFENDGIYNATGDITISNELYNNGTCIVQGNITNTGTFISGNSDSGDGIFEGYGNISNGTFGFINNYALFTTKGDLTNNGNLNNFENLGFTGCGTIEGRNTIENYGALTNNGIFNVHYQMTDEAAGVISNSGSHAVFALKSPSSDSTGSFVDNGSFSNSATCIAEKYFNDGRWWYTGSPVSATTGATVFTTLSATPSTGNRLLYYSESTPGTINDKYIAMGDADNLLPMRGYTFQLFDGGAGGNIIAAYSTTGAFNTGDMDYHSATSLDLTRTTGGYKEGYNLVSNPYPSAVDITGATMTNLETSIWYSSNGTFSWVNSTTGAGSITYPGGQPIVPSMQSFWVRVSSGSSTGSITIHNSDRQHSLLPFYKKSLTNDLFRMNIQRDTLSDDIAVGFYQDAQDAFDNYDTEKMFADNTDYPQLYSLTTDNTEVSLNGQSEMVAGTERIVPVGFKTDVAGSFTMNATNLTDFDSNTSVFLEDTHLNVLQNMRSNNTYTFSSGVVNDASRFRLHFGYSGSGITTEETKPVEAYAYDNNVYVNVPDAGRGMIEIFDMTGQLIFSQQSVQGLNKLQLNVSKGVYMVKVQDEKGVVTKKVMID